MDDVFNAILVRGDAIGDVVFYGRGAGKMPTASAVVADVIDCAKHLNRKKLFGWGSSEEGYVAAVSYTHLDVYKRQIRYFTQAYKGNSAFVANRGDRCGFHIKGGDAKALNIVPFAIDVR